MVRCHVAFLTFLATAFVVVHALAYSPPPIAGHVTDVAGKLSPAERDDLDTRLEAIDRASGAEIAVLIVPALGGNTIEDVAYDTFNTWKLGKKGADNGALLVIAVADRRMRIETGKGVEGQLTDLQTQDMIQHEIGPALKQDRFYDGIRAGTDAIAAAITGQAPSAGNGVPHGRWQDAVPIGLMALFALVWITLVLRRMGRRGPGGSGGWRGPGAGTFGRRVSDGTVSGDRPGIQSFCR